MGRGDLHLGVYSDILQDHNKIHHSFESDLLVLPPTGLLRIFATWFLMQCMGNGDRHLMQSM